MNRAPARRILVADELSDEGIAILRGAGEVVVRKGMDEKALHDALAGFDALVVRSATRVTARALEGADRLALIGRAGIGVDNIDVEAATARGIIVMNTPEAGAVTTGELAFSLLLALARKIPAADRLHGDVETFLFEIAFFDRVVEGRILEEPARLGDR